MTGRVDHRAKNLVSRSRMTQRRTYDTHVLGRSLGLRSSAPPHVTNAAKMADRESPRRPAIAAAAAATIGRTFRQP